MDGGDDAVARRPNRQLHLHGFERNEKIALRYSIARLHSNADDGRGHRRRQRVLVACTARAGAAPDDVELEDFTGDADPDRIALDGGAASQILAGRVPNDIALTLAAGDL